MSKSERIVPVWRKNTYKEGLIWFVTCTTRLLQIHPGLSFVGSIRAHKYNVANTDEHSHIYTHSYTHVNNYFNLA